jgi:hypothetical protein
MSWLPLLLGGFAVWMIWTGRLQRMRASDGAALGLALVGAVLAAKGKPILGAPLLLLSAGWFLLQARRRKGRTRRVAPPPVSPAANDLAQARALLGLPADADADAVRAAHRRLIAAVHPDKGGSEALAAQINAARDLLLRDADDRRG